MKNNRKTSTRAKTIRVSVSVFEKLEQVKENLSVGVGSKSPTWDDVMNYLSTNEMSKVKAKGISLAEKVIIKLLMLGHHKEINASEIRKLVPVNLEACNKVLGLWSAEIAEFNNQFKSQ